jgi:hypothetical protein
LKSKTLIDLPTLKYPVLNISIVFNHGRISAVGRVSNGGFKDNPDLVGRPIQLHRRLGHPLQNGIIKFNINLDGSIYDLKFIHKISNAPNYEDPRIFVFKGQEFLVMTKITQPILGSNSTIKSRIVIENLYTKEIIELPNPLGSGIEKNWVPVENSESITLLYSSNPITLIEVRNFSEVLNWKKTKYSSIHNFNNRSQIIKTHHPEIPYIRVVSKKFASRKFGYTPFHYFEILTKNLKPSRLSRPFIFNSRKQEYCQGITLINDQIYLSWSEQEKFNFIGSIGLDEVLSLFK